MTANVSAITKHKTIEDIDSLMNSVLQNLI